MSDPDKEISKVGGSAAGSDDEDDEGGVGGVHGRSDIDDDDDDDDDDRNIQRRTSYVYEYGCGITRNFSKAKKVVLFPFTKAKKLLHPRRKTNNKRPSSSSGTDAAVDAPKETTSLSGNTNGNRGVDVCLCFTQPQTLESSVESKTSDPNDPIFTYDMLKALIEKNDFYSKDCNPHLDFHDHSCCDNTTG